MLPTIVQALIDLNQHFYHKFAEQFSATRQRLQPGVIRILDQTPPDSSILDLGCGNGELARQLEARDFNGSYVGLDFSSALLVEAQKNASPSYHALFQQADLASPDWTALLPSRNFNRILAFAVLHHIPGHGLRLQLMHQLSQCLAADGLLILSNWQFLNSERLRSRIQPWSAAGLSPSDVEPGDYLLDWRRGGQGLRYIHHFSAQELEDLAAESGFQVVETFYSDGEGGNLGLYQVWRPA